MELGIQLSSQPYCAGSRCRGTAWARVHREIRGSQLEVTVIGKEMTQIQVERSIDRDEQTFLNLRVPVDNAQLVRNEAGSGVLSPYKCERGITVQAKPDHGRPVQLLREPTTIPVKALFSRRSGTMSLGVALDNTRFSKGIPSTIKDVCRNSSPQDVMHVRVKLISRCQWRAHYRKQSSTRTLWIQTSHELKALLQKLPPGVQRDDSVRNDLTELMNELLVHSTGANNKILVETPPTGAPSYSGELMKVWHELIIEVKTKSFVTDPTITIPVQLFESPGPGIPTQQNDTPPVGPLATAVPADFENKSIQFDEMVVPNIFLVRPAGNPDVLMAAIAEALAPSSTETL